MRISIAAKRAAKAARTNIGSELAVCGNAAMAGCFLGAEEAGAGVVVRDSATRRCAEIRGGSGMEFEATCTDWLWAGGWYACARIAGVFPSGEAVVSDNIQR